MARKNFTLEISGAVPPLLRCRLGCGECELRRIQSEMEGNEGRDGVGLAGSSRPVTAGLRYTDTTRPC